MMLLYNIRILPLTGGKWLYGHKIYRYIKLMYNYIIIMSELVIKLVYRLRFIIFSQISFTDYGAAGRTRGA